ncbi:hypothetical protein GOP47_0010366 [Adiantum capillus-veneris]|uniref:Remorin C-terminal domain-containing protein n=1 Tax=Adiantum capillus-veneris TaxID=13818 RepID=A0A9D4UV53_ADICA|nr:hypothetical protein GOP47_0010366 [Adiantum capillus-veneris]
MARRSAIQHPNSGNDGGQRLQPGKPASSESSASEKAEDNGERQGGFPRYPRSSEGQLGFNRTVDDSVLDYDSSYDHGCTSSFEFQKGERGIVRPSVAPYLNKVAPSKWDDAEKWLVSPTSGDAHVKAKTKSGPLHGHYVNGGFVPGKRSNAPHQHEWHGNSYAIKGGHQAPYTSEFRNGHNSVVVDVDNHPDGTKLVTMLQPDQNPHQAEGWTKDMDPNIGPVAGPNFAFVPAPSSLIRASSLENHALTDASISMKEVGVEEEVQNGALSKPTSRTRKPISDALVSVAPYNSPAPAVRSISMRDMGTEMTPIASQEPSRTGTPIRATTPTFRSPVSSCPSSPRQGSPTSSPVSGKFSAPKNDVRTAELGAKVMQVEPRREGQSLGLHIGGKLSIVPWASKEEEDADASKSLKTIDLEDVKRNVLETRAAAWEDAEQSKYLARFKREEAKILAWESHQKAKAEAELRHMEVKVEKIRMQAHEKLLNKLAAAREKAEERMVAAEMKRCEQAAKTSHQADYIRQTGRLPSFFSCNFCL